MSKKSPNQAAWIGFAGLIVAAFITGIFIVINQDSKPNQVFTLDQSGSHNATFGGSNNNITSTRE